jgi:hypothetical protein
MKLFTVPKPALKSTSISQVTINEQQLSITAIERMYCMDRPNGCIVSLQPSTDPSFLL